MCFITLTFEIPFITDGDTRTGHTPIVTRAAVEPRTVVPVAIHIILVIRITHTEVELDGPLLLTAEIFRPTAADTYTPKRVVGVLIAVGARGRHVEAHDVSVHTAEPALAGLRRPVAHLGLSGQQAQAQTVGDVVRRIPHRHVNRHVRPQFHL